MKNSLAIGHLHYIKLIPAILSIALVAVSPTYGLITSDAAGSHIAAPGSTVFGINHAGVAHIQAEFNSGVTFQATGALLKGGTHILTSAHQFDPQLAGDFIFDMDIKFELDANTTVTIQNLSQNQITIHPDFTPILNVQEDIRGVIAGYDIALINLGSAISNVPGYDIWRGGLLTNTGSAILSGYGFGGSGMAGASLAQGTKRIGLNHAEPSGDLAALVNEHTMWFADFDSGQEVNNAYEVLFNQSSNLGNGDDEVFGSLGDSGGPVFTQGVLETRIGGVISTNLTFPDADPNPDANPDALFTWGEIEIYARIDHRDMYGWIDKTVYNRNNYSSASSGN